MARCEDCIHYEICDEYVSPCESFPEVDGCKCFTNKADVVPRSEVEEIIKERELNRVSSLTEKFLLEDQEARYKSLMAEHDREVAREIFEEIEKIIIDYQKNDRINRRLAEFGMHVVKYEEKNLEQLLAELKKKYTESEDKGCSITN